MSEEVERWEEKRKRRVEIERREEERGKYRNFMVSISRVVQLVKVE